MHVVDVHVVDVHVVDVHVVDVHVVDVLAKPEALEALMHFAKFGCVLWLSPLDDAVCLDGIRVLLGFALG